MKLTPEQLVDWFLVTNPKFPPEFRAQWLAMVASPPDGARRSDLILGMKQGINDTLTTAKWLPDAERSQIETALAARGLPSLRKMDAGLKRKHQRILARGCIKNDEEFYVVAEILGDVDFEISESDRAKLGQISHAYETRPK
jgi:hypothetical protein